MIKYSLFIFFILLNAQLIAGDYYMHNNKLSPSQSGRSSERQMQVDTLADVVYHNQNKIDSLNSKLIDSRREIRDLELKIEKLEKVVIRLQNYYFRSY